ncbi:DUF3806 domain-containing protein [Neorhodopirellula pilleata]|nr:DUF3806 domain-containing protein [Neorhodopirellula pilleata]
MMRLSTMFAFLLSLVGCAPSNKAGGSIEDSIRQLTSEDESYLNTKRAVFTRDSPDDVRARFKNALLGKGNMSLADDLEAIGVVFGDLIANDSPMTWVTVEFEGERMFAMTYPKTSVVLFPIAMIDKRARKGEVIDLPTLVSDTIATVERSIQNPEYQR